MADHVHLIVTPADSNGLRSTFGEAHRRYTGGGHQCHLFQDRFGTVVMDEPQLLAAARYIALNPVVAGPMSACRGLAMVERPPHLTGEVDELATVAPLRALIPDFCFSPPRPIPRRRH
jgi:putative transposase